MASRGDFLGKLAVKGGESNTWRNRGEASSGEGSFRVRNFTYTWAAEKQRRWRLLSWGGVRLPMGRMRGDGEVGVPSGQGVAAGDRGEAAHGRDEAIGGCPLDRECQLPGESLGWGRPNPHRSINTRSFSWGQEDAGLRGKLKTPVTSRKRQGPSNPNPPCQLQPRSSQPHAAPQPSHTYRLGPWNPLPQGARQLLWAWEALAFKQ